MSQPRQAIFNRHNAIYLGICLSGLLLLVGFSLLPLRSKEAALRLELEALTQEVEFQRQNQTSVVMVDSIVSRLDQQPTPKVVPLTPLAQDKTKQIDVDIKAIGRESSLTVVSVKPQHDDSSGNWQILSVAVELRGQFAELRGLLLKVLTLPYVKRIERLEIHSEKDDMRFLLTYTVTVT